MRYLRRFRFAAVIAAALLTGASCSPVVARRANQEGLAVADMPSAGDAVPFTIEAVDFRFIPAEISVETGSTVFLTLVNKGRVPHSILFDLPSGPVAPREPVLPGSSATITFQVPHSPGRYLFFCPMNKHRLQGMEGGLIVRPQQLPSFPE